MSLAVAIQMDAMNSIDIAGDSTFALALEGQARRHALTVHQVLRAAVVHQVERPGRGIVARDDRTCSTHARPVRRPHPATRPRSHRSLPERRRRR